MWACDAGARPHVPACVRSSAFPRLRLPPLTLGLEMTFIERNRTEGLAEHLLRNADHLGLTQDQQSRLRAAFQLGMRVCKDKSAQAAARAEGQHLAVAVQGAIHGALTHSVTQGKGPGEAVVAFNSMGAARVRGRDGLASLLDAKALTEDEVKVGLAYRLLFEQCGPGSGLGSQLEDRPRAVRASTHGAVAYGLLKAYAGVRLTGVDTAVQNADASGRALAVLRAVAGEGRTIRSLGGGGNTRDANLEALKRGLRIALAALKGNGGLRIRGH